VRESSKGEPRSTTNGRRISIVSTMQTTTTTTGRGEEEPSSHDIEGGDDLADGRRRDTSEEAKWRESRWWNK